MAAVRVTNLSKRFGETDVLRPCDLLIEEGEFVVIVGPSGCGKSTLLRLIAGLEEPTTGQVFIGEEDVTNVPPGKRGLAMVFQSYALYPHLTVEENIAFPLKVQRLRKAEIAARVEALSKMLNLAPLLKRRPAALSGGQRQRVSIARAIVREPQVLLLDEPLSNLDAELRVRMRHEFARLHARLGSTMIYVTHDQLEAMTLANRIVVMSEGRIEQVGPPLELYEAPATLAVARAIGSPGMNLIAATIAAVEPNGVAVSFPGGEVLRAAVAGAANRVGEAVTLGVRPEHLTPDSQGPFRGAVELFERLGPLSFAHIGTEETIGPLVAQLPGDRVVSLGETLRFGVAPEHVHIFGSEGQALPRWVHGKTADLKVSALDAAAQHPGDIVAL